MGEETVNQGRRSTRLSISIPVVLTGLDADGNEFREQVRTLIVNKHGGKVATAHHLAVNSEITIENHALNVVAKAHVVWLSGKHFSGEIHHVGLQLIEAQNVWGIAFPPDDWSVEAGEEPVVAAPEAALPAEPVAANSETPVSSLAGEEITIRLLQELQHSADDHAREFKDRVKQLTQRVGLELEFDLRERAAFAKTREVGALEEEIKCLQESLSAARREVGELQARLHEMKGAVPPATENPPSPAMELQEARRQLCALANSIVQSMNSAAAAGLSEYRSLLQKENQRSAERVGPAGGAVPLASKGLLPES